MWFIRGRDKIRECTGYGIPLIGMSVLATEDGVQNIVAGGGKVMRLSSGHGRVEGNKNAADWYKTVWLAT